MRRSLLLSLCCAIALAQNPEAGHIERQGNQATLVIDSPRPVDSAAVTLAEEFGLPVNVEDPPYLFHDDVKGTPPALIPKGGPLQVHFPLGANGAPLDLPSLLQAIVDDANARYPFHYRVHAEAGWFTLIPSSTRDDLGRTIPITPLLDRRVTIPGGIRSIAASANLMTEALSVQTGLRVSCCQVGVAGIPWGMKSVYFEAHDEPARSVLKRLLAEASEGRHDGAHWLQRCDPAPSAWCSINVAFTRKV